MSSFVVPLKGGSANAHQTFRVSLGDFLADFEINYIHASGKWSCDLTIDGVQTAAGLMLEPNCNIIEHYQLDIGQLVFVGDETTLDNLGINNQLIWVEPNG